MLQRLLKLLVLALLLVASTVDAPAQRTSATYAGIVTDASGAVVPGAAVELVNEGTHAVTTQATDQAGEFVFNFIPVGSYRLKISSAGFKVFESQPFQLGAAQNLRRTFVLEVGAVTETVNVSAETPLVNTISPEQRLNLETREIANLPVTNRNISQILDIGTGITRQEATEGLYSTRFRLNGLGGQSVRITANGTDASGAPGSVASSNYQGFNKIDVMSTEAIAEVQTVKGVMAAEYGHALAGNISLITKSGTNELHGSIFHRYEGSTLSAKPQFLTTKRNSVWNQFGGSLGGPIIKDRAFFFTAYEAYRQRTVVPLNASVPSELSRREMLAALPFPETEIFLSYLPAPNQPTSPNALSGLFIGPGGKEANDDHIDGKGDVSLWGGTLSTAFTFGHPYLIFARSFPKIPREYLSRTYRGSASYVIGRARWTSETRFGANLNRLTRTDGYFYAVEPSTKRRVSRMSLVGVLGGIQGVDGEQQTRGKHPVYSFEQQVAVVSGKHSLKFGGILHRPRGGRPNQDVATVTFDTREDLLANRPTSMSASFGSNDFIYKQTNFGFFAQDDWRMSPKLVLNLGIRQDRFGRFVAEGTDPSFPAALYNFDGLLDRNFNFGPLRDPKNPFENDNRNIAPRFGFAYNPDGRGKTVVRGGFGAMFQPLDSQGLESAVQSGSPNRPRSVSLTRQEVAARGLRWPVYHDEILRVLESRPQSALTVTFAADPHIEAQYAMNFTLGIQRTLTPSVALETAFVGTRGVKFLLARAYNQVNRLTGIRPNPNLPQGSYQDNSQQTSYYSWQSSLRKRFTRGLLFNVHYTWGKAMAYGPGDLAPSYLYGYEFGDSVQDFWDVKSAHGPAAGDVTHSMVANWVYAIPALSVKSPVVKQVLGGWEVSGILRAATGSPIQILQASQAAGSRPDVLDIKNAINRNCCAFGSLQYLNPSAFQRVTVSPVSRATSRPGNIGSNALRGPGLWNMDLSFAKNFSLHERKQVQLRADFINSLNHTNYTTLQTDVNFSNFGQITGTAGARIIQVQARLSF